MLLWLANQSLQSQSTCPGTTSATLNGVPARVNCPIGGTSTAFGYNYETGVNTGYKWQCVEYVNRYYYLVYQMNLLPTAIYGNASNYYNYNNHTSLGLVKYANGGSMPPQAGDMIVSTSQTYGHIAIVKSVTSTTVVIVDQNLSINSERTLTRSGNTVGGFNSSYPIAGWVRRFPAQTPTLINPANSATGLSAPITFTWSCSNCTEYRIQIVEAAYYTGFSASNGLNGSSCTNCAYNGNLGNATSFLWTGAQPGKTYYWTVRGSNPGGASSFATYRTFTTASSTGTCTTPTTSQFSLGSPTTNSVFVSVSYSGANSYGYQYRQVGVTNWIDWSATGSSTTISGLASGTNYEVKVRVRCSSTNAWSNWSSAKSFSTTSTTGTCTTPTTSQFSIGSTTSSSAVVTITLTSGINNYDYQYRTLSGTWIDLPATTVNTTTISGLTSGVTYEVRVAVRCSSTNAWSNWSSAKSFTTTSSGGTAPTNDNPCGAITISANSSCTNTSGTNVGATTTTTPGPPTSCTLSGGDVWFKVQVPSSGVVTIRLTAGTLTDALMAVYYGSSCSSLSGIVCEDDNTNGNGSLMPVITITGYTAGTWLYARIWGYGGATGTFSICAMNYSTVNKTTEFGQISYSKIGNVTNLYPNPAINSVTLEYLATAEHNLTIGITDLAGRLLDTQTVIAHEGNNKLPINIENLSTGFYMIIVQNNNNKTTLTKLQVVK